jgi:hypothetical protein
MNEASQVTPEERAVSRWPCGECGERLGLTQPRAEVVFKKDKSHTRAVPSYLIHADCFDNKRMELA